MEKQRPILRSNVNKQKNTRNKKKNVYLVGVLVPKLQNTMPIKGFHSFLEVFMLYKFKALNQSRSHAAF